MRSGHHGRESLRRQRRIARSRCCRDARLSNSIRSYRTHFLCVDLRNLRGLRYRISCFCSSFIRR